MKILVTGGAGYLGSALLPYLSGYDVTVFDSLLHGGTSLLPYFKDVNFHFVKGDIRNYEAVRDVCKDKDAIIHLAAIVGLPACEKNRETAQQVNYEGTNNIIRSTYGDDTKIVYASTVSVYGKVVDGKCKENTPTRPLSLYGSTKLMAERDLVQYRKACAFRFPTLFGVSPRMRLDLMVNEMTYEAVTTKAVQVFQPKVTRTFLHVNDAARAIVYALDRWQHMAGEVFLPGDDSLNITKLNLARLVCEVTGANLYVDNSRVDGDGRDYEMSFSKIKNLGFSTKYSLKRGIEEVQRACKVLQVQNPYRNT